MYVPALAAQCVLMRAQKIGQLAALSAFTSLPLICSPSGVSVRRTLHRKSFNLTAHVQRFGT
jgi:hypothetical protein